MFGNRLRKLRQEHNLSQEELASRVHVHTNTVSKWENGVIPNMKKIIELAGVLKTTSTYLLGETDNPLGSINPDSIPISMTSDKESEFMEKVVQSNKMLVYETQNGNERIFVPATTEGFNFIKQMMASNLVVQPA